MELYISRRPQYFHTLSLLVVEYCVPTALRPLLVNFISLDTFALAIQMFPPLLLLSPAWVLFCVLIADNHTAVLLHIFQAPLKPARVLPHLYWLVRLLLVSTVSPFPRLSTLKVTS